ncbi:PREDICTED: metaxin-2 isoform X2 [Miniopterus natalensis]|uniref:metaxin-2 isoform X2 n=1 Tax=Miniopterus natalensis TaxID=291302 RepID=UPI0007A6BA0E|nr:PREDICTED: metaxin-2 isoform X2 [Miniopterus natalensis]
MFLPYVPNYHCLVSTAAEPWPENATLYQQLKGEQILLSDNAASLAVQAFLQMCNLPIKVVCKANAEYMSPSGKVPFIHVGNQVVSELGPIVQFVKAKGHSLSDGLDEVQKAEMKAYMELVNNMLLTAELYLQWCDEATVGEITLARYGSPYPWPLNRILAYQKQWEVKRKMKAIGWGNKTLDQAAPSPGQPAHFRVPLAMCGTGLGGWAGVEQMKPISTSGRTAEMLWLMVLEDVDQCCQALSQRLGTQPYFFNKQPTELDALVFGHLYTILTTQLTNDELSEKVKNYSNLLAFCRRIEQHYFEDGGKGSSSIRLS